MGRPTAGPFSHFWDPEPAGACLVVQTQIARLACSNGRAPRGPSAAPLSHNPTPSSACRPASRSLRRRLVSSPRPASVQVPELGLALDLGSVADSRRQTKEAVLGWRLTACRLARRGP